MSFVVIDLYHLINKCFFRVDCILTARNKARIKACNYMIAFTLVGCLGAVLLGKKQAARGENLLKQREEWLKEQNKNK